MNVANIFDSGESLVGSIVHEAGGFRISWRERMESGAGNVHSVDRALHSTFEEARQAVFRVDPRAKIAQILGGDT